MDDWAGFCKCQLHQGCEPFLRLICAALLTDEYWYVRVNAAKALGEIGDERAVEALTQALEDEHDSVRYWAEQALKKIQGG